jgi:hypothetical protein
MLLVASEAALEERTRVSAILQSPEAWLRGRLARYLALETEVSASEAIELLRAAPATEPGNATHETVAFPDPQQGAGAKPGKRDQGQ